VHWSFTPLTPCGDSFKRENKVLKLNKNINEQKHIYINDKQRTKIVFF